MRLKSIQILLMSDDAEFAESLKNQQYQITLIDDFDKFWQHLYEKEAILLIDTTCDMKSLEAIDYIRLQKNYKQHVILVVVYSPEQAIEYINAGADDYLLKSAETLPLQKRLDAWLEIEKRRGYYVSTEYMAFMASELRTPLTSISGYSKFLLEKTEPLTDTQRHFLHTIMSNANKQAKIISQYNDVAKLDDGTIHIRQSPFDLNHLENYVDKLVKELIAEKQQQLHFKIAKELPKLSVDGHLLAYVLTNLIENAATYSANNSEIIVEIQLQDKIINFLVQDRGYGIHPNNLPKIFSKFFRSDEIEIRQHAGQGLGLYIARGLVELMGGEIWVESEYGKGSKFHFTIPIASAD
jgi:signal transduction histidine kinase